MCSAPVGKTVSSGTCISHRHSSMAPASPVLDGSFRLASGLSPTRYDVTSHIDGLMLLCPMAS